MALLRPQDLPIAASAVHCSGPPQSSLHPVSSSQMSGTSTSLTTHTHYSLHISYIAWILDTGVTDHMACSTTLFTTITSTVSYFVKLPNDHSALVTHIGTIHLTNSIIFHDVLCVPSFSFNLISANKLTSTLNCCLLFFSTYYFIQDLHSWITLGRVSSSMAYTISFARKFFPQLCLFFSRHTHIATIPSFLVFLPLQTLFPILTYGIVA